jgi:hypothetical protein
MKKFKGLRYVHTGTRDKVSIIPSCEIPGAIIIIAKDGHCDVKAYAEFDTKTARKIAAELVRMSDEIDGVQS